MKEQEENSTSETIEIEYTEQDIQEMREQGVLEDELPRAGVHKFQRSKFVSKRSDQKIKVSIYLDADIFDFFKEKAKKVNAAPFEEQIIEELRRAVLREDDSPDDAVTLKMLDNPKFLSSLAEKLKNAA